MQEDSTTEKTPLAKAIASLPVRAIGPAFMGGRIADIAVHPTKPSTWYLAVGSGGVWKTTNAGTTWKPIFDEQPSYSIGCVTIDPNRPDVVWVGTGEAVSGRHVAWGDGIYRSLDGGASWTGMGLQASEHIAEILVDPENSDVVYVAAEGPLWSSGGERGVYKTADGGATWQHALKVDAETGVTSLCFAPGDSSVMYAATYQRRRRVWGFLGGGPGSGIHKSTDGGSTWRKITQGLPKGDMGKIGLAVSPAAPDTVYATVEADKESKGLYRSTDRGESWERRNEYISGGTGPHYYQEIFASPTNADRVYQVDVFVHWTPDGGETVKRLETGRTKHSDNHVVWIDPADGDHLLIGADAGLYETFDHGHTFRHFPNLPISQFYRVAIDNAEPFYNVLGGAQDLGTLYGPARTQGVEGVRSQDWTVTLGADGYHVAFDPGDPDIAYMEWQNGNVLRMDRRTMELQDIQPQGLPEDPPERWNWDCPIVISPHQPSRIYVASQRLWRSDDRGESWTAISGDLTRDLNRYELPIAPADEGGRVQSVDALWDHMAMSMYSTITHLSESPLQSGLLYVGTDDGLIQVSEDGGTTWRRAGALPNFPDDGFINNVKASEHDADIVFAVADAHKNGDYSPYVFESSDRGATWSSISGDLADRTIIWAIQQDHVDADLLFLGGEHGMHVSLDRGQHWHTIGGVPTISFRDIALHRRDDDLVGASFGRGFYVLDDYSALRGLNDEALAAAATLLPVRDAWWYVPHQTAQAEGQPTLASTAFASKNPPFGAAFTYHVAEDLQSAKEQRTKHEKMVADEDNDIEWPGWEQLWDEQVSHDPHMQLVVRDQGGTVVRRIAAETKAGLHRTTWDLRLAAPNPVKLEEPAFREPWETDPQGPLVAPGTYSVELIQLVAGNVETLGEAQQFFVKPTPTVAEQPDLAETAAFNRQVWELCHQVLHAAKRLSDVKKRLQQQHAELLQAAATTEDEFAAVDEVHKRLEALDRTLNGDRVRERLSEAQNRSIKETTARLAGHLWDTTQAPTDTQRTALVSAAERFESLATALSAITSELPA